MDKNSIVQDECQGQFFNFTAKTVNWQLKDLVKEETHLLVSGLRSSLSSKVAQDDAKKFDSELKTLENSMIEKTDSLFEGFEVKTQEFFTIPDSVLEKALQNEYEVEGSEENMEEKLRSTEAELEYLTQLYINEKVKRQQYETLTKDLEKLEPVYEQVNKALKKAAILKTRAKDAAKLEKTIKKYDDVVKLTFEDSPEFDIDVVKYKLFSKKK